MRDYFLMIQEQLPFHQARHHEKEIHLLQGPVEQLWKSVVALCWNLPYTVILLAVLMGLIAAIGDGVTVQIYIFLACYGIFHQWQKHRMVELEHRQLYSQDMFVQKVGEYISSAQAITLLNLQEREQTRLRYVNTETSTLAYSQWQTRFIISLAYFLALTAVMILVWVNVFPISEGAHTGAALSLMLYSALAVSVIAQSEGFLTHWHEARTLSHDLKPWLVWHPSLDDTKQLYLSPPGPISIEIDKADFVYPGTTRPALAPLTMTIAEGECVGIRGKSGSGKSTLLLMIAGLVTPSNGNVRAFGVETSQYEPSHWLRRTGVLPTRVYIFSTTLAENIAGIESRADAERIMVAANQAGLESLIQKLDEGLATPISDHDARISESNRLRIGIARLYIRPYALLLLDEPGARLSDRSRKKILPALEGLVRRKTVCICSNFPEILVLTERVISLQSHESLPKPETTPALETKQNETPALTAAPQGETIPLVGTPTDHAQPVHARRQRRQPQPRYHTEQQQQPAAHGHDDNLIDEIPQLSPSPADEPSLEQAEALLLEGGAAVCESAQQFYKSAQALLKNPNRDMVLQGVQLLIQASKLGFAPAQSHLGMLYETGHGLEANVNLAAQYYEIAAKNGDAGAQSNFAVMLEKGLGIEQNSEHAVYWYAQAAAQGDAKAQNNLGVILLNNAHHADDHQEAANWFQEAAHNGHISAMYNLGMLLERSPFVHDIRKACFWYMRAAAFGHALARERLEVLSRPDRPN